MINRLLLRVKSVQTLYSFFVTKAEDGTKIEKELMESIRKSGDLYYCVLQLAVEMRKYLDQAAAHAVTEDEPEKDPMYKIMCCQRFRENRVSMLLEENKELREAIEERKLTWTWDLHRDVMREIAIAVSESDAFKEYEAQESGSFAKDVELWCHIMENEVQNSEKLEEMLEEMSIYWNDDLHNAVAFAIRTLRSLKNSAGEEQPLVPLLKAPDDLNYAKRLVRYTLMHYKEADGIIEPLLNGWHIKRLPVIDLTILRAAYGELKTNSETHSGVVVNEYTDIAKGYCEDKNVSFISAVLFSLAKELRPLEAKKEKR